MDYIEKINDYIKKLKKRESINILIKNVTNDTILYSYKEKDIFVSASIIKIPIMLAMLNQVMNKNVLLENEIEIDESDILYDNKCFKKGIYKYKVNDLITWMIIESDNSSTNILIKYLGLDKINKYFKEIGLEDTKLERLMLDKSAIKKGKNNYTSLCDMYKCFKHIVNKDILTDELCNLTLNILYKQQINNQINKYIKNVKFAHKTGSLEYLNSDVGIFELNKQIYFIGISIYNTPRKNGDKKSVAKLSKIIYKYINNRSNKTN